jgi:hypothetical protein
MVRILDKCYQKRYHLNHLVTLSLGRSSIMNTPNERMNWKFDIKFRGHWPKWALYKGIIYVYCTSLVLKHTPSVPNYLGVLIGTLILSDLWGICENAQLGSIPILNKLSNEPFCTQNGVVNKRYDGLIRL